MKMQKISITLQPGNEGINACIKREHGYKTSCVNMYVCNDGRFCAYGFNDNYDWFEKDFDDTMSIDDFLKGVFKK